MTVKSSSISSSKPQRPKQPRKPKTPGVVLLPPSSSSRTGWRVRYRDPDTGKTKWESIPRALTTTEQRTQWCKDKSRALQMRELDIARGAPRAKGAPIGTAIASYYTDNPRLRDRTVSTYKRGTDKLREWCASHGVRVGDDLTLAHLSTFRAWLSTHGKQKQVKGGWRPTKEIRAPRAVNVELRACKTVLRHLHAQGLTPKLSRDDIAIGLKSLAVSNEVGPILRGAEIPALLEAALAQSEAFGQFVRVVLLTGMRFSEAQRLDWSRVVMQEREIRLRAEDTKTKTARAIDLDVSPSVVEILQALGPKKSGSVFGLSPAKIRNARARMKYSKPWDFQMLRRTCGTYLTCAPGIFGAASAYHSARRLGHSVAEAERDYLGQVRGIPAEAKTLEDAMGLPDPKAARG